MTEYGKVVEERGKSWECNFSEQFPISHIDNHDDKTIVTIGPPHMNYQIITHLKNKILDGESTLISVTPPKYSNHHSGPIGYPKSIQLEGK